MSSIVYKRRKKCRACRWKRDNYKCAKDWKVSIHRGEAKCHMFESKTKTQPVNLFTDLWSNK